MYVERASDDNLISDDRLLGHSKYLSLSSAQEKEITLPRRLSVRPRRECANRDSCRARSPRFLMPL